jgi:hypothetical protein
MCGAPAYAVIGQFRQTAAMGANPLARSILKPVRHWPSVSTLHNVKLMRILTYN